MTSQPALETSFARAIDALAAVATDVDAYRQVDDRILLELARLSSLERQITDTHASLIAGEISRRSAPELGSAGLAQRTGYRTPQELVRVTTKTTARDAGTAVRMGQVLQQASPLLDPITGETEQPSEPWLQPVASAMLAGTLTAAAADAIRSGLGAPEDSVTTHALHEAATELCGAAVHLDPDRIFRLARQLRDTLDEDGIADRERQRYERRSLRVSKLPDGTIRAVWILSGEHAAVVTELYDRATSPRRGGPRFVDEARARQAQSMLDDARTTEQLASDVFVELLRQGANADDSQLLGSGAPVVMAFVAETDFAARRGHGFVAGQADTVSVETIERLACTGELGVLKFDAAGQPFDEAREQRFYTRRQRRAMAARDGGCRFPECDRPASWTEAHHIKFWARDNGKTDIADGILLCRHHHLLLHNNHWEIERGGSEYWLIPPPDIDPEQIPIEMPSQSAVWKQLRAS